MPNTAPPEIAHLTLAQVLERYTGEHALPITPELAPWVEAARKFAELCRLEREIADLEQMFACPRRATVLRRRCPVAREAASDFTTQVPGRRCRRCLGCGFLPSGEPCPACGGLG